MSSPVKIRQPQAVTAPYAQKSAVYAALCQQYLYLTWKRNQLALRLMHFAPLFLCHRHGKQFVAQYVNFFCQRTQNAIDKARGAICAINFG